MNECILPYLKEKIVDSKREVMKVQLRIPRWLWDAVGDCSTTIVQSKNQFVLQALAQRVRNWTDPMTGDKVVQTISKDKHYKGWMCGHGSHDLQPATDCRGKKATHKKEFFNEDYPGLSWVEYCSREGVEA